MIEMAMAAEMTAKTATQAIAQGFNLKEVVVFAAMWTGLTAATLFWSVKWLLDRHTDVIGKRFDVLEAEMKADREALHDVERSLMQLKADLPLNYVRKEDAVRHEAVFNAKLDALASKIDNYAGRT